MSYIPPVPAFISFYELDPSLQQNCIYVLKNRNTCRWPRCEKEGNLAASLRKEIAATPVGEVSLDLLQEYIRNNCCMSGNAKHKERIEDVEVLEPLARRWLDEIKSHAEQTASLPSFEDATQATPATMPHSSPTTPSSQQWRSFSVTPSSQSSSSVFSATTVSTYQQSESRPRYDLRSGDADVSITYKSSLSEFRPHIVNPLPDDSVARKIVEPLVDRDFEKGSLYIFSRESSPGYVKIGWTSRSIRGRLDDWAKCGYTPNLLFRIVSVANAQRAETLTHFELMKEWRRERRCKGPHCLKSHQEWFEVSIKRASTILKSWTDFMNRAKPYSADGVLTSEWWIIVKEMERKEEFVTSQKLLKRYEEMQAKEATLAMGKASLEQAPKIKKEEEIPIVLEHIPIAEQKTPLQDNKLPKDIQRAVSSLKDEKLTKSEPIPAIESVPDPEAVKKELLPEEIPLTLSPILRPAIDSAINSANVALAAISSTAETSKSPSEQLVTHVARILMPLT